MATHGHCASFFIIPCRISYSTRQPAANTPCYPYDGNWQDGLSCRREARALSYLAHLARTSRHMCMPRIFRQCILSRDTRMKPYVGTTTSMYKGGSLLPRHGTKAVDPLKDEDTHPRAKMCNGAIGIRKIKPERHHLATSPSSLLQECLAVAAEKGHHFQVKLSWPPATGNMPSVAGGRLPLVTILPVASKL